MNFEGSEALVDDGWRWSCRTVLAGQNGSTLIELALGRPEQCQLEVSDPRQLGAAIRLGAYAFLRGAKWRLGAVRPFPGRPG